MTRKSLKERKTTETDISIELDLDRSGPSNIVTPVPFFTHMLELFARHGSFALNCRIRGDVEVDLHHTIEDSGLVLGSAFKEALGDKKGIERYGFHLLPMDETLVRVALDLSGRPFLVYDAGKLSGKIGEFDMDYCRHFFHSLAFQLQMNLHIHVLYGQDKHHVVEAVFKGVARSLSRAVAITGTSIPSTKGIL